MSFHGHRAKSFAISAACGVLLFAIWCAIIVAASDDFEHEGPHTALADPLVYSLSIVGSVLAYVWPAAPQAENLLTVLAIAVPLAFAPFIALLSYASFLVLRACGLPWFRRTEDLP